MFPALKTLRYCNSNIPAMDKINLLVKRVDEALFESQKVLEDKDLFGSIRVVILSDCQQDQDEVFGETNTERINKLLRYDCFSLKYFSIQV